jgi:hypothetical protein
MRAGTLPLAANLNTDLNVTSLPRHRLHPRLRAALTSWEELTDGRGYFDRSRRGLAPLLGSTELVNERSTIIVCEADDPLDYLIAYYGGGFGLYEDRSFVGQRMRDVPDRETVLQMIAGYQDVIRARRPLAQRIAGRFGAIDVVYDRLILPAVNGNGEVDRLITVSAELERQP